MKTYFASPERTGPFELKEISSKILADPVFKTVLQAVEGYAVILNENRQILACNDDLLDSLGLKIGDYIGLRPGEAFNCQYAAQAPAGCGTSEHCRTCGAVLTILATQELNSVQKGECYLNIKKDNILHSIEFQVHATPVEYHGNRLIIFVLIDISKAKRKEILEKVFFHDINNILTALAGSIALLKINNDKKIPNFIITIAEMLQNEINFQETLIKAENGTLKLNNTKTSINSIMNNVLEIIERMDIARDKKLICEYIDPDIYISIDTSILKKIIINMLKNAFEAVNSHSAVRLFIEASLNEIAFCVHNTGFIDNDTALKVFHRSFSTKSDKGRGIGTYSMKLFGENYLKGKVGFTTSHEKGTVFYLKLKRELIIPE